MSTEKIASFIVNTGYEQIEPEAISRAKNSIIDFLGVTIAGSLETAGELVAEYARETGGKPEAGVIGSGFKAPAAMAALANGTMAHSLDYDDACNTWIGHPSAPILPAVMALGEKHQKSGREVLESYIIGFEIGARVGLAIGKRLQVSGWHTTATIGSIAAAAATAKLLKLNVHQTIMALGIAASLASGIGRNFGTMTKPLHAGNAARNGVLASILASKGFTAGEGIMESEKGFCRVFGADTRYEVAKLTQGLGEHWNIITPGIGFKYYPSCHGTHALVDAALALHEKWHFNPDDIVQVECVLGPKQSGALLYPRPQTGLQGKFSIEYCVSLALLEGGVKLKHFTDEKLSEPGVQKFLPKVKRTISNSLDCAAPDYAETVTVRLNDGKKYSHSVVVSASKGEPRNPMTLDELSSKYRECASLVLRPGDLEKALVMASELENLEDISTLMHPVVFGLKKKTSRAKKG